jgi:hypothetical protein
LASARREFSLWYRSSAQQFAPEFFIGARTLHLIENELVVLLDRLNDLSKFAHLFLSSAPILGSGVCHKHRYNSLREINPNNSSTPGSRCRFATVSISR